MQIEYISECNQEFGLRDLNNLINDPQKRQQISAQIQSINLKFYKIMMPENLEKVCREIKLLEKIKV